MQDLGGIGLGAPGLHSGGAVLAVLAGLAGLVGIGAAVQDLGEAGLAVIGCQAEQDSGGAVLAASGLSAGKN